MFSNYKNLERRLRQTYGTDPTEDSWHYMRKERLPYIQMFHKESGQSTVDDITWNDLEMDHVFFRINHTQSYVGEQILYHRLHVTDAKKDWETFERNIEFFDRNEHERIRIEKRLCGIGKAQGSYYLPVLLRYVSDCRVQNTVLLRLLQLILLFTLLGTVLFQSAVCMTGLILILVINITIYIYEKSKMEGMLTCFQSLCVLVKFCEFLRKEKELPDGIISPIIEEDIACLKKLARLTGSFSVNKTMAQNDPQALFMDYFMGITLWDLINFNRIIEVIKGHESSIMRLFEFVGEIDMCISVASFRKSIEKFCVPEFWEKDAIQMYGMRHPLLKDSVENDATLGRYTILTGANASGKSTFMKAVAVNSILSQTIHTCCAESFSLPYITIMTSMALRDDVIAGESYYVREVKYLKRMLDYMDSGKMVLCIIDEILKGTNTVERMAASEAVLKYLRSRKCYTIVATHDLRTAQKMQGLYENFYFKSIFTENGIAFDYKIQKGIGGETNAIALLAHYQFPEKILGYAKQIMEEIVNENQ